jgi:hypothetical protein
MLASPGYVPNAIALPVSVLDFATITVTNPPWATPADVAAAVSGVGTGAALNLASNIFIRAVLVSPGVWQSKLPGEL